MLISREYKRLNQELHEQRADYGANGAKWAQVVIDIAKNLDTRDVLDYGCGKATLSKKLALMDVKNYDPSIDEHSSRPKKADIVCCLDVLEHVEPNCLVDVLWDISSLSNRALIAVIATRPAVKFLSDGRNAHLIQKDLLWWLNRISVHKGFKDHQIQQINNMDDREFLLIMKNTKNSEAKEKINL